jgi:hypothetical protein
MDRNGYTNAVFGVRFAACRVFTTQRVVFTTQRVGEREKIFLELMTSDRKLREGSKGRIYGT